MYCNFSATSPWHHIISNDLGSLIQNLGLLRQNFGMKANLTLSNKSTVTLISQKNIQFYSKN